ncbi:hypothetical protein E308F_17570 [Moorella sp. E308F]|uniref:type IV secretory system conjugative DNA transfer family protein n=1 Tax=unclassified Neomoorella TaxID=2676739 RepID=UPI0010FFB815|nr:MULTISPECIES: ATP-binding protein [unclassified Moorella (in: firmicutes)]GEA15513.1 hypothetical protein E308F_17570 [Moorella sp. E308F]GEA19629.1 hypothetical protein E306M_27670 [Moorella sp. E306M]
MRIRLGLSDHAEKLDQPIYFPMEHLMKHAFICGKTGSGKTVTLLNWCLSMAENLARDPDRAAGFTFIDPHGDAVNDLLERLPDGVADRVHVLHFRDTDRPRGFNLLEAPPGLEEVTVGAFVDMLRDLFPMGTGYRMEHILKNALLTLARVGGQTILSLEPLLSSESLRAATLPKIADDPVLRSFWENQFPAFAKKAGETLGPIWNKLGAFATYPRVRRVVGQPKSTIDPLRVMDEGHILLVDLSGAGEDVTPLMGGALVNRFHFSALSRAGRPREGRRPHVLIADEVHNYATRVMANILSEDRKFGLGFVIATQYLERIPEDVLEGILGNVGTMVVLYVEEENARRLVKYFPGFTTADLVQRKALHAAIHTTAVGSPVVFTMRNPIPPPGDKEKARRLLALSDQRDGVPAGRVDAYVARLFALAHGGEGGGAAAGTPVPAAAGDAVAGKGNGGAVPGAGSGGRRTESKVDAAAEANGSGGATGRGAAGKRRPGAGDDSGGNGQGRAPAVDPVAKLFRKIG